MPGYNSQRRGVARTSQINLNFFFIAMSFSNFFIVLYVPFSMSCVQFMCTVLLPPGVNPFADKYVYIYIYIYIYIYSVEAAYYNPG
jgi:hypothetical protein